MAIKLRLKHSSVADKAPLPTDLVEGELALNINNTSPAAYIKDSTGVVRRIAGITVGGTAPAAPTAGVAWLDITVPTKPVFKIYDGTAWQGAGSGVSVGAAAPAAPTAGDLWVDTTAPTAPVLKVYNGTAFVAVTPDATETVKGVVELATAAETTTGTDATRAVHPAGLKVELDKKANLAGPSLTGVPKAPTAAAATNTTQLATTAFVHAATPAASATVKGLTQLANAAAITAGTAGLVVDAAQLKAATPAATEAVKGIVELATAAETTTGTDATRAVHPAGLKVELDKLKLWTSTSTHLLPKTAGQGLILGGMTDAGTGYIMKNAANTKSANLTFDGAGNVQFNAVGTGLHLIGTTHISLETAGVVRGTVDSTGTLNWGYPIVCNTAIGVVPTGGALPTGPGDKGASIGVDGSNGAYMLLGRAAHSPLSISRTDGVGEHITLYNGTSPAGIIGTTTTGEFGFQNQTGIFGYIGSRNTQMRFQGNNGSAPFCFLDGGHNVIANINVVGMWQQVSDRKLKTNIEALPYGLAEIKRLEPKSYHFKTVLADNPDARKNIGLIAQEVKEVIPEVVADASDGVFGITYSELIPVLINAVKELSAQVDALKAEVQTLKGGTP